MENQIEYKRLKLYQIAMTTYLGSISWGYNVSIPNSLRVFLQTYTFPDSSDQSISLIASMLSVGACVGSWYAGTLATQYGRLKTLMLSDLLGILGSCLCLVQSLPILIIGRTIVGAMIGIHCVVSGLYTVEISPTAIKGRIGAMSIIFMSFGSLLAFATQFLVPINKEGKDSQIWRVLFGIGMLLSIARLLMFSFVFSFETPFYLVLKGRITEARQVLKEIYIGSVDQYIEKVGKDVEVSTQSNQPKMSDLFTDRFKGAMQAAILVTSGIQLSGFSPVFVFFNILIKDSAQNDPTVLSSFSTIMGVISFINAIFATTLVEKFGRKTLLTFGMALTVVCLSSYSLLGLLTGSDNPILKYVLLLWPTCFRLSSGTFGFLYVSEALPALGISLCVFLNWVLSIIIIQSFLPLVKLITAEGVMLLLSCVCLFLTVYFKRHLVETKGRTKAEILDLYYRNTKGGSLTNNEMEMNTVPLIKLR